MQDGRYSARLPSRWKTIGVKGGVWLLAKTYTTRSGDTWDLIAYEQMGYCRYVDLLMDVNRMHVHTGIFATGTVLAISQIPADGRTKNLPPWRR